MEKKIDLYLLSIPFLLFMAGFQLFGRTTIYFGFMIIPIAYVLLKKRCFKITLEHNLIVFFCIFYILFGINNKLDYKRIIVDSIMYITAYIAGYLGSQFSQNRNKSLKIYMYSISIGLLIHGYLNYLNTINVGTMYAQLLIDIWTKTIVPSTQVTSWFLPSIALFIYLLNSNKKNINIIEKIYILISIGIMLVVNFNVAARTNIIILAFIVLSYIILKIVNILKQNSINYNTIIKVLILVIIIISVCIFYNHLIIEYISIIKDTPLFNRVTELGDNALINDPRVYRQIYFIMNFTKNLWGGYYFKNSIGAMHNLWMDTYDSVGIIPFVILILYTISIIINLLNLYKNKQIIKESKIMLLGVYIVFMILFMTEPILESGPLMFAFFIFINGFVSGITRQ